MASRTITESVDLISEFSLTRDKLYQLDVLSQGRVALSWGYGEVTIYPKTSVSIPVPLEGTLSCRPIDGTSRLRINT